jgi:hypothetical protein
MTKTRKAKRQDKKKYRDLATGKNKARGQEAKRKKRQEDKTRQHKTIQHNTTQENTREEKRRRQNKKQDGHNNKQKEKARRGKDKTPSSQLLLVLSFLSVCWGHAHLCACLWQPRSHYALIVFFFWFTVPPLMFVPCLDVAFLPRTLRSLYHLQHLSNEPPLFHSVDVIAFSLFVNFTEQDNLNLLDPFVSMETLNFTRSFRFAYKGRKNEKNP